MKIFIFGPRGKLHYLFWPVVLGVKILQSVNQIYQHHISLFNNITFSYLYYRNISIQF